jgi:hypothetical protein
MGQFSQKNVLTSMRQGRAIVVVTGLCVLSACSRSGNPPPAAVAQEAPVDVAALRPKAEAGDVKAQRTLGEAFASGRGVPPNYKEAVEWLTKAAEQGDAAAQYNLAQLYEAGQGVKQSYEEAGKWYLKAADQGHAGAQYGLAVLYGFGRGLRMSDPDAAKWFLKAAENGDTLAMFNIGQRYRVGRGVAKDPVEAFKWLSLASSEVPDSATIRDEVKSELSRQQLAESKRRADEFTAAKAQAKPKM